MAIVNGSNLILKLYPYGQGSSQVGLMHSRQCTMSINLDVLNKTTSDSGGWKAFLGTQRGFSLSADGVMDFSAPNPINTSAVTTNIKHMLNQLINRAEGDFTFTLVSPSSGDVYLSGKALITSIEISGGTEDVPTYSISLQGTGTLTVNTQ